MARKKEFTPAQIIEALHKANGIQANAARILKTSRTTINNYIKDNDEIRAAYEQVNETTIDKVEGKLLEQINKGNITAIIFYLKTKAKHRGYIERTEHTGTGEGGALIHKVIFVDETDGDHQTPKAAPVTGDGE